jgi:homoserine dehydrogenase
MSSFRFEASVGGGIPILNALTTVLQANHPKKSLASSMEQQLYLTQMTEYGLPYEDVLKVAQEKDLPRPTPRQTWKVRRCKTS